MEKRYEVIDYCLDGLGEPKSAFCICLSLEYTKKLINIRHRLHKNTHEICDKN